MLGVRGSRGRRVNRRKSGTDIAKEPYTNRNRVRTVSFMVVAGRNIGTGEMDAE